MLSFSLMHHVYVIENEQGGWYIGYSTNLKQRLADHNNHMNISTAKAKKWKLIYCETYVHKMDALGREKFLKSGSGRKFLKKQMLHYLTKGTKKAVILQQELLQQEQKSWYHT